MTIYLFIKGTKTSFAELTVKEIYVGDKPQAFLQKTAQNYANIRKEPVIARARGLDDASADPKK